MDKFSRISIQGNIRINFSFSFFESGGEDQEAPGSSQSQPSDSDAQSRLGNVSVNPGYSTNKEGNEYYAGGAQSGIGVMAPPTGKPVDNDQFVKDLFKVATETKFLIFEISVPKKYFRKQKIQSVQSSMKKNNASHEKV